MHDTTPSHSRKIILILLTIVAVTIAMNIALAREVFMNGHKSYVNKTDLTLLDPSIAFIEQENLLVNFLPLRNKMQEILNQNQDKNITIYFEYLNTGANISFNNSLRLLPASLTKVPTAMIIAKKIENGDLSLDTKLELNEGNKDPGWGDLYKEPSGSMYSLEFLLKESLEKSDNTAQKILYQAISQEEANAFTNDLGLEELFDGEGKVTSKEYSRIFRALYTSSYLNPVNSELLLSWLTDSTEKEYLRAGVPRDVPFAHKFGADIDDGIFHDSGIVYAENRPYILTVLIDGKSETTLKKTEAMALLKLLSESTYEYVINQ